MSPSGQQSQMCVPVAQAEVRQAPGPRRCTTVNCTEHSPWPAESPGPHPARLSESLCVLPQSCLLSEEVCGPCGFIIHHRRKQATSLPLNTASDRTPDTPECPHGQLCETLAVICRLRRGSCHTGPQRESFWFEAAPLNSHCPPSSLKPSWPVASTCFH